MGSCYYASYEDGLPRWNSPICPTRNPQPPGLGLVSEFIPIRRHLEIRVSGPSHRHFLTTLRAIETINSYELSPRFICTEATALRYATMLP